MQKEYTNCINAFTAQCPNRDNKNMINLLANPLSDKYIITDDMLNIANELCRKCTEFISR